MVDILEKRVVTVLGNGGSDGVKTRATVDAGATVFAIRLLYWEPTVGPSLVSKDESFCMYDVPARKMM